MLLSRSARVRHTINSSLMELIAGTLNVENLWCIHTHYSKRPLPPKVKTQLPSYPGADLVSPKPKAGLQTSNHTPLLPPHHHPLSSLPHQHLPSLPRSKPNSNQPLPPIIQPPNRIPHPPPPLPSRRPNNKLLHSQHRIRSRKHHRPHRHPLLPLRQRQRR